MRLRDALRSAAGRMREATIAGDVDSESLTLAAHALGVPEEKLRTALILDPDLVAPEGFDALVEERLRRVPLQHITGRAHFRHLRLSVGPGVFVPRPETEFVAQLAIDAAGALFPECPVVVDLCTGSGAIALAVAQEVRLASVWAVEVDPLAIAWAQRNLVNADLEPGQVQLVEGDATALVPELEHLMGEVDVVVSNPPYIPVGMVPVDPEVRDHDPEIALYGGSDDGLRIPLLVAARAADLLRPGGVLVMEHADTQGESLPAALRATGRWTEVVDHRDLTGRPRATVARLQA